MARRPIIPQRKVIFVGCEGTSETGYVGLLHDFALEAGLHIHLAIHDLGQGAGDPQARVEMAIRRIANIRKTRIAPSASFVLLDRDQVELNPQRAQRAQQLADQNNIRIVWQDPCFEAVLLRHLPNCANNRPVTTPAALQSLTHQWQGYQKPLPRLDLAKRITLEAVLQAAAVEPDLAAFLAAIGLIAEDDEGQN